MHIKYNDEYDVIIEYDYDLLLSKSFYELLEKGNIKPKDILFENCDDIELDGIIGFTKVSDYGTFGEGIGNFNCSGCENLTSLDGSPEKVGGKFDCYHCNPNFIQQVKAKYGNKVKS